MKWQQICLVVAALIAASSAAKNLGYGKPHLTKLPKIYEDKIIEMLKYWIANGIPELGVPTLDPLEVKEVAAPVISYHDVVKIDHLVLKGTRVDGLGKFDVVKVSLDLAGLTGFDLEVHLTWPSLKAQGERYEFNASLVGILDLHGAGKYEVEMEKPEVRIRISIRTGEEDGYLYVSAIELGPVTFSQLNNNLENLIEPGHVSDVINEAVHLLAKQVWDQAESAVAILAERLIKDLANDELSKRKITMEDVMEWISNMP